MKVAKAHFLLAGFACLALCLALVISLAGYFHSVERSSSVGISEKKLVAQFHAFSDQLKAAESPEQAKAALKAFEAFSGFSQESEVSRELKKTYNPVLATFGAKPREADSRVPLAKKRDMMDSLVNAYRKEIPNGDIRVRAAYLNILFDVQSSLVNDNDETELVFLKRNRERLDSLKGLTNGSSDQGLVARVSAIEQLFASYEKAFSEAAKWKNEKSDALMKAEKTLPALAKSVVTAEDSGLGDTRRTFIYVCFLCLLVAGCAFLALLIGHKVLLLRSELKVEAFVQFLRSFGMESVDAKVEGAIYGLKQDGDWGAILVEAQRAKEEFLLQHQGLLSVPRSLQTPYLVLTKDKTVKFWNESGAKLFGLSHGRETSLRDLLKVELIKAREGETEKLFELLHSSHNGTRDDRFELSVRQGDIWTPWDVASCPIASGPLAGGRIYLLREIRSEAERVEKAVSYHLERAKVFVRKITGLSSEEVVPSATDTPSVREIVTDLQAMKRRLTEREMLWKSETEALADQVTRQEDILKRLHEEIVNIRGGQTQAIEIVRSLHGSDEHLHEELCVIECDLEHWNKNRQRLLFDLKQQGVVMDKARKFEEQLRFSTEELRKAVSSYEADLGELRQFAESARLHATNLSLVRDPGYWEHASRSRAFAHSLTRFSEKAAALMKQVSEFLNGHPGGALAAHLHGPGIDPALLLGLKEEQEKITVFLKRWKDSGQETLAGGEKALELLVDADKKGAVATQLGETSLLINEQAKGNLERWN